MKKLLLILITFHLSLSTVYAQDGEPFRAYLYNNEYEVYLNIDFYDETITVPGQDLYGQLPGYLGKKNNSFCWLITSVRLEGNNATLAMINDYGSEDLTATLTCEDDSTYILKQESGSQLKVPKNGKWQKLPSKLEFRRR
jgi:hypothetical protein